jgi:hypothetical protein
MTRITISPRAASAMSCSSISIGNWESMFAFSGRASAIDDFDGWKQFEVLIPFDTCQSQSVDGTDQHCDSGWRWDVWGELPLFGEIDTDTLRAADLDALPDTAKVWLVLQLNGPDHSGGHVVMQQRVIPVGQARSWGLAVGCRVEQGRQDADRDDSYPTEDQCWKRDALEHSGFRCLAITKIVPVVPGLSPFRTVAHSASALL